MGDRATKARATDAGTERPRRTTRSTYACRHCRETVTVTSLHQLPERCADCGAGTWEDDGRCSNWVHCEAMRRPDSDTLGVCNWCGYSVWVEAASPGRSLRR